MVTISCLSYPISGLNTGSGHDDDYDMWSVTIDEDTIRAMRQNNQVTVRLTVGGKSEVFDISPEDNKLLIDLYVYLLQMRQYTDP